MATFLHCLPLLGFVFSTLFIEYFIGRYIKIIVAPLTMNDSLFCKSLFRKAHMPKRKNAHGSNMNKNVFLSGLNLYFYYLAFCTPALWAER
jgi:hypothetical protein